MISVKTAAIILALVAAIGAGATAVWTYRDALVRAENAETARDQAIAAATGWKNQAGLNADTQARGDAYRIAEQAADRAVAAALARLNQVDLEAPDATARLYDAYLTGSRELRAQSADAHAAAVAALTAAGVGGPSDPPDPDRPGRSKGLHTGPSALGDAPRERLGRLREQGGRPARQLAWRGGRLVV